jgi:DNA repair exonuclease SbcCD nuclease subunit
MLGDLFDDRTSVPILIQTKVEQLLIDVAKVLPIHLIVGNHDCWNRGNNDVNSPRLFRHLDNVNIYDKTHTLEIDGNKLVLMPWVEHKSDMLKEIDDNPGDYLFCHSDLNGCRMHLNSVAFRNKDKIEVSHFKKFKKVWSGHIHLRQVQENFEFIGAPYQMDRNDYDDKKGMTILDLETGETSFVENKISPTFKKFKIEKDGDILLLEHVDTKKYFVDLEIHNSVLVGKRKNRKLLEQHLSNKKFASVDYINDLVKKDKVNLPNMKEVDINDLQFDDFDNTILEYVESQEYENDEITKGVIKELNNVLNIYKKEYKFKTDE